ncbi:growth hormone-regulated TBC protein 1 isoform X3 [Hippopotamus amphibius kiboko]|uniref:growth hormone-regulated TBC protein 1 isoform X3 n=1 Tax=Hippopotamus amphibius kiboko TaxID=575201 RepID=UPI00259141CF|nr:growth hormone-regulated TBC protein 1 isoform X3 [Hippopotamus amphibius kiboko]
MEPAGRAQAARERVPRIDPYGFERPEDFDDAAYEAFFSTYLGTLSRRAVKWSRLLRRGGSVQRGGTHPDAHVLRDPMLGPTLRCCWVLRCFQPTSAVVSPVDLCLKVTHNEALHPEGHPAGAPGSCLDGGERSPGPDGPEPRLLPESPPGREEQQPGGGHQDRHEQDLPGQRAVPQGRGALPAEDPVQRAAGLRAPQPRRGLLPDYYGPSMLGLKTDQEVLGELVRTKLPAVAALMDGHGVLWTLVVSRWFICLFVDVLPVETVLRIWDCLFNEGSKIIFRVALTLIKQHQALILEATSIPDICEKFKEITGGGFVTECHTFMQSAHRRP